MKKGIILFVLLCTLTQVNAQVTLFSDWKFSGPTKTISADWSVSGISDSWNDGISSIKIQKGWQIVVYSDINFGGRSMVLTYDWSVSSPQDPWNDQISSIRVIRTSPSPPPQPVASAKKLWLEIKRLCCDNTTENGADEVYIIVTAKSSKGRIISTRFPGERNHFDMNDSNQPTNNWTGDSHCISDGFRFEHIFDNQISRGERWDVIIVVLEEDGGTTKTAQEIGGAILTETGDPIAVTVGQVLGALSKLGVYATDKDDYIGSIVLHVSFDDNGQMSSSYKELDRARITSMPDGDSRQIEGRFGGDGSDYLFQFHLRTQ